jgi:hypothetical protein
LPFNEKTPGLAAARFRSNIFTLRGRSTKIHRKGWRALFTGPGGA